MRVALRELTKAYLPVTNGPLFDVHIANLPSDYAARAAVEAAGLANARDTVTLMYRDNRDLLICVHYHVESHSPYTPRVFAMRSGYTEGDVWKHWPSFIHARNQTALHSNKTIRAQRSA